MSSDYTDPPSMDFADCYPSLAALKSRMPLKIGRLEKAQARYRSFADRNIRPIAVEVDRKSKEDHDALNWDFARLAAKERMFSIIIPKLLGGQGGDIIELSIMLEELCAACTGLGNLVGTHYLGFAGIAAGMNLDVIGEISDEIIDGEKRGEAIIASAAHTEPQAGSDVEDEEHMPTARVGTTVKKVDGGYLLNGQKVFISDGHYATWHMVSAYEDKADPLNSTLLLVTKTGMEGFNIVSHERKMGQRATPASTLIFEDCFVPDRYVVTIKKEPFARVLFVLGASRVGVGAIGTGCARNAYEKAVEIAKTEKMNGKYLIDEQWVQQILADMLSNVMISRAMYLSAAWCEQKDGMMGLILNPVLTWLQTFTPQFVFRFSPYRKLIRSGIMSKIMNLALQRINLKRRQRGQAHSSMAKFIAGDMAMRNANLALDIAGAAGLAQSAGIEKVFRDAKLVQIYEGTNQINRKHVWDSLIARKTTM